MTFPCPLSALLAQEEKQVKASFSRQGETSLLRTPVTSEPLEACRQALNGTLQYFPLA